MNTKLGNSSKKWFEECVNSMKIKISVQFGIENYGGRLDKVQNLCE